MKAVAAVCGSTSPRFVELDEPAEPHGAAVLCRTAQLGVCGTDREILHSAKPHHPPEQDFLVLGHECLGRVLALGPDASSSGLAAGDWVVPLVRRPSHGTARRVDMLPFGQYTERGIIWEHGFSAPRWLDQPQFLVKVPPQLAEIAVLAEPLSVAEKAIHEAVIVQQARLQDQPWRDPQPRVLVTGMGPIGFAAVLACRARHWPVTMFGRDQPDSFRARLAVTLGAAYLTAEAFADVPEEIQQAGYDLVLECTGSEQVLIQAAQWLVSCGVMVWLGSSRVPEPVTCDAARLLRNAVVGNQLFLGSVNAAPRDFEAAICHLHQLFAEQPQSLQSLITARVDLDESLWHFEHRAPQGIKTVIMYQ